MIIRIMFVNLFDINGCFNDIYIYKKTFAYLDEIQYVHNNISDKKAL